MNQKGTKMIQETSPVGAYFDLLAPVSGSDQKCALFLVPVVVVLTACHILSAIVALSLDLLI